MDGVNADIFYKLSWTGAYGLEGLHASSIEIFAKSLSLLALLKHYYGV